jgi:hypothetical protein
VLSRDMQRSSSGNGDCAGHDSQGPDPGMGVDQEVRTHGTPSSAVPCRVPPPSSTSKMDVLASSSHGGEWGGALIGGVDGGGGESGSGAQLGLQAGSTSANGGHGAGGSRCESKAIPPDPVPQMGCTTRGTVGEAELANRSIP